MRALGSTQDYALLLNASAGVGFAKGADAFVGVFELSADLRLFRFLTLGAAARFNSSGGVAAILNIGADVWR